MNLLKLHNFMLVLVLCLVCYYIRDALADSHFSGNSYSYYSYPDAKIVKIAVYQRYAPSAFVTQPYPSYNLTIAVPSDWQESTSSEFINEIGSYLSPLRDGQDTYRENIMIATNDYTEKPTLHGLMDAAILKLQELQKLKIIDTDLDFKQGGNPAYKVTYSFEVDRKPFMGMQIGTLSNSTHNIQLTYVAELGRYAEYLPAVNRIIDSVMLGHPLLGKNNGNATWIDFENKQNNLTLSYPPNWSRAREGFLSSVLTIYPPLDNVNDTYFDNVRIITANLPANVSLEENVNKTIGDYSKRFDNFKLKENSNVTLDGSRANKLIYTYTTNDTTKNHQAERIFTINKNNNKSYVILLDTTPVKFSAYLPTFDKILSTTRIR